MDYDKIFPSYVRGNGCYLDVLPKDVTNIIYDFKYDGSSTIYNDIINLRIIKNDRNIIDEIVIRENTPISIIAYHQFFIDIIQIFGDLQQNENDVFRAATCYIIMWYVFLYKTDFDFKKQNASCKTMIILADAVKKRLMQTISHPASVILNHYISTLLNDLEILISLFEAEN